MPVSATPARPTTPEHGGIGHNGGPPLFDDAPPVPPEDPGQSERWQIIKRVARWTATRIGILAGEDVAGGGVVGLLIDGAQIGIWIHDYLPYLEAYNDPPRTLAELQAAARGPSRPGYDVHHVVWQTDGAKDGMTDDVLQSGDNLVSISTLRHWELNSWFQRENETYGGRTPRDYLRDKGFAERTRVGLEGLRQIGVLKP